MQMNPSVITIVSQCMIDKDINFWFTCSGTVVPSNSHRLSRHSRKAIDRDSHHYPYLLSMSLAEST